MVDLLQLGVIIHIFIYLFAPEHPVLFATSCVISTCNIFVLFQNHAFVRKTEQEYLQAVNFGEWVRKVMNIAPLS